MSHSTQNPYPIVRRVRRTVNFTFGPINDHLERGVLRFWIFYSVYRDKHIRFDAQDVNIEEFYLLFGIFIGLSRSLMNANTANYNEKTSISG